MPADPRLLTTDVDVAVMALLAGGLVGLPTETVYGLAADAQDAGAVARVYAAKGRPADHPLIVHVTGAAALDGWARDIPGYARALAQACWPGPLTLVLPRGPRAGDHVTGGQDTVGLRAPAHPLAQQVIAGFARRGHPGGGLAAPSANRFGRVSPTTAAHVVEELSSALVPGLDCVLDGGASAVGVESTIVDCTAGRPAVLRPGALGTAQLEQAAGVPLAQRPAGPVRAPGMLASHYAPRATVVVTDAAQLQAGGNRPDTGLLAPAEVPTPDGVVRLSAPIDVQEYARALYAALREADALGLSRVVAVPPTAGTGEESGLIAAVADRLHRAAAVIGHCA